jgi:hypothetical protein
MLGMLEPVREYPVEGCYTLLFQNLGKVLQKYLTTTHRAVHKENEIDIYGHESI